jgi:hypothetical protein
MQNARTAAEEKPASAKRTTSSGSNAESRQPNIKQREPDDVEGLKSRIADLEKLVSKLVPPKTARKRR